MVPIAIGVLGVGGALALGAYVVSQANSNNARISAACASLSSVADLEVISAAPIIGVMTDLVTDTTQQGLINTFINGLTDGVNGIRTAANTNACST